MPDQVEHLRNSGRGGRIVLRQAWAALRLVFALAAGVIVLSGCAIGPGGQIMSQEELEERVPMQPVALNQAWISAPDTQLVLQRDLGFGSEQRISLRNRTPVPGDNLMVLRTRAGMHSRGTLRFEEFMRRVGEIPEPFGDVTSGELISGEDEFGSYLWTEERFGADTICVFGIRRIDSSMRQIPGGGSVMDVMLRNCVAGTAGDALQPLLAGSVAVPSLAQAGPDRGRLISPLAGPTMP